MDRIEAQAAVRSLLDELRKKYVPVEGVGTPIGQLGFDYGYHQALAEVDAGLYRVFPEPLEYVSDLGPNFENMTLIDWSAICGYQGACTAKPGHYRDGTPHQFSRRLPVKPTALAGVPAATSHD